MQESTRKELQEAFKIFKTGRSGFNRQEVDGSQTQCYVLERQLLFLTEPEFSKRFKMSPTEAGITCSELVDESGLLLRGVPLQDPQAPYRKLRLLTQVSTALRERLFTGEQQLRAAQGKELFEHYTGEAAKLAPGTLKPGKHFPTAEEMEETVAKKRQALSEAAAVAAVIAATSPRTSSRSTHSLRTRGLAC